MTRASHLAPVGASGSGPKVFLYSLGFTRPDRVLRVTSPVEPQSHRGSREANRSVVTACGSSARRRLRHLGMSSATTSFSSYIDHPVRHRRGHAGWRRYCWRRDREGAGPAPRLRVRGPGARHRRMGPFTVLRRSVEHLLLAARPSVGLARDHLEQECWCQRQAALGTRQLLGLCRQAASDLGEVPSAVIAK